MNGFLLNPLEYPLDYLIVKFANLKNPTLLPWIEVGAGAFVYEESVEDQLVFLTKPRQQADTEKGVVTAASADEAPTKTHLKKKDLIQYLETKLREPLNSEVIDYGPIEDVIIQPAGKDMTKEVYQFLAKYGVV